SGRAHERLERPLRYVEVQVVEHLHRLFAAEEGLGDIFELDDRLLARAVRPAVFSLGCHQFPFSLIFCPSASSGGGLVTTRAPLAGPSTSSRLPPKGPPTVTGAMCTTLPSTMNATFLPLRSVTAAAGITFLGACLSAASLMASVRKLTRALMSGRTASMSSVNLTFTLTVAF